MKKRLLSVLLCVAMTASMVIGCGAKEEKKDDSAKTESSDNKEGKIYLLHKGLDSVSYTHLITRSPQTLPWRSGDISTKYAADSMR